MDMLVECFRARMSVLRPRFPLREFRERFVEEYAAHGMVLIQGVAVGSDDAEPMRADGDYGFVFSTEAFVNRAIDLCRQWGFQVERHEYKDNTGRDLPAYAVTIPYDYLRNKMSSEHIGMLQTRDRSCLHRQTKEAQQYLNEKEL